MVSYFADCLEFGKTARPPMKPYVVTDALGLTRGSQRTHLIRRPAIDGAPAGIL